MQGIYGLPGPRALIKTSHKYVMRGGAVGFFPGGGIIDTANTRDPSNSLQPMLLSPGFMMGRLTATGYWAAAFLGATQAALTTVATSLTLTPAAAVELVRRRGAAGTFKIIGPPAAAGTVATATVTYSAVNTTTGVVTITATGVAFISGSLIGAGDGSEFPRSMIEDGMGLTLGDSTVNLPALAPWPRIPIEGMVQHPQLEPVTTDASLKLWVQQQLSRVEGGKFTFSDVFSAA